MSEKKQNHIIVPNEVFKDFTKENTRTLSVEEIYLYCWLYRRRIPDDWYVETSIDHINNICCKFASGDESRNKRIIKQMLISLKDKEYINTIDTNDIHKKTKNSDTVIINFSLVDSSLGYNENIEYKLFDQFEDPLELFIYAYIDCFGSAGRDISYYKWGRIAKRSESTIKSIIEKMNSYNFKPRIWKFSGDYYQTVEGVIRQQENTYYTRPSEDVIKKWNGFYSNRANGELAFGHRGNKREKIEDLF